MILSDCTEIERTVLSLIQVATGALALSQRSLRRCPGFPTKRLR